jgi:hypothetical protein
MKAALTLKQIDMNNEIATYFGILEKSETLRPMPVGDSFVYESQSPFFGYYDDYPGKHNDITYVYMLINCPLSFVELHGILLKAMNNLPFPVDMAFANLHIFDVNHCAIRARGFDNIALIPQIKEELVKLGVVFASLKGKSEAKSLTSVSKYFFVEKIEEGVWIDQKVKNHGYIMLPGKVDSKYFNEVVEKANNNWQGHSFNAAQATLSGPDVSINAVRIYSTHVGSEGYLADLKRVFLSAL